MKKTTIGFALCGSFCTFNKALEQMKNLINKGYEVIPIMSYNASNTDTRFGKSAEIKEKIKSICKQDIIDSIVEAEPIGPKNMVDVMLICPCTGNTLAKLCYAITDTPVTMAAKSQLRVQKPVIITLATNDALGASAQNIGKVLNSKNIYFVPIKQDDPINKPHSLVSDFSMVSETIALAMNGTQIQPVFL